MRDWPGQRRLGCDGELEIAEPFVCANLPSLNTINTWKGSDNGQKFEKDENEEILYFVISLSKLVKF